jgi:periplasmic protein TonB
MMKTAFRLYLLFVLFQGPITAQQDSTAAGFDSVEIKHESPIPYVEKMPAFPGDQEEMYKYIYSNMQYPAEAKQNKIGGQVIIQFVVSAKGEITNPKVIRSIGFGCDEEALRLVNSMPRWTPGNHNGRAVPVTYTLPIKFVLK